MSTMDFNSLVDKYKKKKKNGETLGVTANTSDESGEFFSLVDKYRKEEQIQKIAQSDIAPLLYQEEEDERTWFDTSVLDKDEEGLLGKVALGTTVDTGENLLGGLLNIGESALDALAWLAPAYNVSQQAQSGIPYTFDINEYRKEQQNMSEFIQKDLYDGTAVAKAIVQGTTGYNSDKYSILGEKTEGVIQSGGQLLGTMGLQAVGVPWFITSGATSFGGEVENAFKQGATYEEAGVSGAVSAGAEIISESLGGFFGKTELDDLLVKEFSKKFSNKLVRAAGTIGIKGGTEALEELFSWAGSKLGQKLTYEGEKTWAELYTSEEAVDELIESMIGGFALGGFGTSVDAVKSGIDYAKNPNTARDIASGMTKHEEYVVQKVYETELAKREEKGTVSAKEKRDLYDSIEQKMERGYISAEDIELSLGGEEYDAYKAEEEKVLKSDDYKAYRKAVEDSKVEIANLEKQLKEVGDKQSTVANTKQYEAIEQRLNELKKNPVSEEIKAKIAPEVSRVIGMRDKMRSNVMRTVDGTRLMESYREMERKKQKFQADVNWYENEYAKKTVQNIINSGLGDNSNQFRDKVELMANISAQQGVEFKLTNNKELANTLHMKEGFTTNGFKTVEDGKTFITVNVDSSKVFDTIVGHELTHVFETGGNYASLSEFAKNFAIAKEGLAAYNARIQTAEENYKGDKNTTAEKEVTADIIGEYLFTDESFIQRLSVEDQSTFQRIWDEVKHLAKMAVAGSDEERELLRLQKQFEKVYRENGQGKPKTELETEANEAMDAEVDDVQYSVSVDDKETLDFLNEQVSRGEYDAETNPDGGYYVTYKSMSFWGYDEDGNAILRSPMAEYVDGKLSDAYLMPKDKSKLNWYKATETIDEKTGLPSGLLVGVKEEGKKSKKYVPASENQDLIAEDWSNLYFMLNKKVFNKKTGKWKNSPVPARYNPYEHSSNSMLNDQFKAAWQRDNLVTVKMYVPVSEDNGAYRAQWSKDPTGWSDWKSGDVATKINKQKDLQRRVYLSRYAAPVEIVPDSEVAQAYKGYLEGTDVAIPDNVVSPSLLKELKNAGVPIVESGNVQYSYSSIANSFFEKENMSTMEFLAEDYHNTEGYQKYEEQCLNNLRQSQPGIDENVARASIKKSIDGIVRVAVAAKKAGYDIEDSANKRDKRDSKKRLLFSSLEPNSDYFTSHDISTICDKRKNFAEIYDEIVRIEEAKGVPKGKRFFDNVDNYFAIHDIMAKQGLTTPCRQCYVESMRKNLAPMAKAFLDLVQETDPNNISNPQLWAKAGKDATDYVVGADGKKYAQKASNTTKRENVLKAFEEHPEYNMGVDDLTIEMLTTAEGLAQLRLQAPLVYEAFNSFYGQAKPKMPKQATPFRFGELTALLTDDNGKINHKLVEKINSTGGFRLQSYSDFQIQNYVDVLQVLFEAGTLGLNGHAYTKVPAFLEATEGTNLKRNISIFMYKDGSEWKLDRNDSFPYALDEIYDIVNNDKTGNTSIIAVSQNADMSAWIMANDFVGYGIPFHKSGLKMGTVRDTIVREGGRKIKGYKGTIDHTKQQTEVWKNTLKNENGEVVHKAETKVKNGINLYSFWDFTNQDNLSKNELIEKNIKAYIDECDRLGYLPKFRAYVMNNGKVLNDVLKYSKELGFVSEDATIADISFQYKGYTIPYGYYKFLGDFGMFTPDGKAAPQQTLSLDEYNFDNAEQFFANAETLRRTEILQQYANGEVRNSLAESDLTTEELEAMAKQKRTAVAHEALGIEDDIAPVQRSLTKDSEGNQLTLEQEEFFKDSKIRDESGNLMPMYHGTANEFTVFDVNRAGENYGGWSEFGQGIYLSSTKKMGEYYAENAGRGRSTHLMHTYANIKNPFNAMEGFSFSLDDLKDKYQLTDYDVSYLQRGGYRLIDFLNDHGENVREYLISKGYDGVWDMSYGKVNQVVAYYPEQIKNADNMNPTADPDIRYSLTKEEKAKYDQDYLEAVENGDEEVQKHLVREYAKASMPDSKLVDENGNLREVYHGTNTGDFTVFNPDYIGMSSGDDGFFGMGFYFAYSKGEASYYGAQRIIPAYLNLTNPFNFQRELHTYNGKRARYGHAPDAVALMNFADKFPDIAMHITMGAVKNGESSGKQISVFEFAKAFKDIIENKEFDYQEITNEYGETETLVTADPQVHEYEYNGETHSWRDFGFQKRFMYDHDILDVAYEYLSNAVYSYIDIPRFTSVILDNNREFTAELKNRGYDGTIQSDHGDEAVAFYPNQIKSAQPVTYDAAGNVIPLSKRFDSEQDDIRYSITKVNELENAYQYNLDAEDMLGAEMVVEEMANLAMPDSKIRGNDGRLIPVYHGTNADFWEFDTSADGGKNGTAEGFGIYLSDDTEVTEIYGDRQIKMFANITKPATSFKKTINRTTLIKLIKDTCIKQAQKMVEEDGYDSLQDALRDTWISNYVMTYDMSMEQAYREVANSFLQQNDNDKDLIHEVMFGMAIRNYDQAMDFYRNSLTPVTGIDGFITKWTNSSTGKTSNIYLAFDSSQLKSADAVTYDDNGNVIPLTERFNPEKGDIRFSLSPEDEVPGFGYVPSRDIGNRDPLADFAPIAENATTETETPVTGPIVGNATPPKEEDKVKTKIQQKIENTQAELDKNRQLMADHLAYYDEEIAKKQAEYNSKQNKNSQTAQGILRSIERLKRLRANSEADYSKRIGDLEQRVEKLHSKDYNRAEVRRTKQAERMEFWSNLIGDTSSWKDFALGITYKTKTLRRILRKVVRDGRGNPDINLADNIYDELETKYDHNEAQLKMESQKLKEVFFNLKMNHHEDTYAHMVGELRHNPETTLTQDVVDEYYQKHKNKIDTAKVETAIKEARKTFDDLIVRVNEVLKANGIKEVPYRKGYFPHFTNPKQNWLQKLLNWKPIDTEIPTSIAGLTQDFKPVKSWQSFAQRRKGDTTDYSLYQGLDTYIHGALDWIYHIDDIQSRRALENYIREIHSDEGVQKRIQEIRADDSLDALEVQDAIDAVLNEANNPLSGFVRELMNRTNTLANKKSSMDREMEDMFNRKVYSTMTNLNNRVNANMVVGSFSSALTNFIPMVQSWHQVSPVYTVRGLKDMIRSTIKDDGTIAKSDFLTNRLIDEEKLYKTGWDKASDKAALMMNAIDNITSQTVWRSKYLQNLHEGMSESAAIKDADQFAKNLIAGRSRGNMPSIFDAKNPLTKLFTAFQLEVANQYGYMFEDAPQDSPTKARLVKGYATAFLGAYVYNALYSSMVGRDAALDPIAIIQELIGDLLDDDEEPEEDLKNFGANILEEVPFVGSLMGGGRIPLSSAFPYANDSTPFQSMMSDLEKYKEGDKKPLVKEMLKPLYYLVLPFGGGQIKKTNEGIGMFSDDHPIAGSYTDSGRLRFPVDDTIGSRVQAAMFGQYASQNARDYFDEGRSALTEKQTQEFIDSELPIRDYWEYRDGLKGLTKIGEKFDYIDSLDLPISTKNLFINNISDRKEPIDMAEYSQFDSYEEFDFAQSNPKKYDFLEEIGVSYKQYKYADEDTKDAYDWAYEYPESYTLSKAVTDDVVQYKEYSKALDAIRSKDENGFKISTSVKERKTEYINSLDIEYGAKLILFKNEYNADDTYNNEIIEYLNNKNDLTFDEKLTILRKLGFAVTNDGKITWD